MAREVKRVPLDFDWPLYKIWHGYDDKEEGEWEDPPTGEGWQMWEDTTEGSPISPVFATAEALAQWLATNKADPAGGGTATYEQWLAMIRKGWAPSFVIDSRGLRSGVEATADLVAAETASEADDS